MILPNLNPAPALPAAEQDLPAGGDVRHRLESILESGEYDLSNPAFSFDEVIRKAGQELLSFLHSLGSVSGPAFWLILFGCLVLLALIFAHGGTIVLRALRTARAVRADAPDDPSGDPDDPRTLLRRARETSDPAEAVRLAHRAAVLGMDRRGLVRFHTSLTCGDLLRQLRPHPGERAAFESLTRVFEPCFFGKMSVGPSESGRCLELADSLIEETAT